MEYSSVYTYEFVEAIMEVGVLKLVGASNTSTLICILFMRTFSRTLSAFATENKYLSKMCQHSSMTYPYLTINLHVGLFPKLPPLERPRPWAKSFFLDQDSCWAKFVEVLKEKSYCRFLNIKQHFNIIYYRRLRRNLQLHYEWIIFL